MGENGEWQNHLACTPTYSVFSCLPRTSVLFICMITLLIFCRYWDLWWDPESLLSRRYLVSRLGVLELIEDALRHGKQDTALQKRKHSCIVKHSSGNVNCVSYNFQGRLHRILHYSNRCQCFRVWLHVFASIGPFANRVLIHTINIIRLLAVGASIEYYAKLRYSLSFKMNDIVSPII